MNIEFFFYIKLNNFTLNVTIKKNNLNIITILGESGSGKTTLLKCISGLIIPNVGFLKINNKLLYDSNKKIYINTNKRKIGYITQNISLFPHLSVIDNILYGIKNKSIETANIIHTLKLNKIMHRTIQNLSGGEKQRVLIAQVLLSQPEIIILDEPLSAQDILNKKIIIKYIKNINEKLNIPIIWVSHNISELEMLSNNIIIMNQGKITYRNI